MRTALTFPDVAPFVTRSLFQGLAGAASMPAGSMSADALHALTNYRLGGVGLLAVDDTEPSTPEEARAELHALALSEMAVAAKVMRRAQSLQQMLDEAGIASLGIKGISLFDCHPEMAPRRFGDIDLLVSPSQFVDAINVFKSCDFSLSSKAGWTAHQLRSFLSSTNLSDGHGGEADIHQHPSPSSLGRHLDFRALMARSRTVDVPGGVMRVVSTEDALVIGALTILSDCGTRHAHLWPWKDLAVLAGQCDVEQLMRVCDESGLGWYLGSVLDCLPLPVRPSALIALLVYERSTLAQRVRWRLLTDVRFRAHWAIGQLPRLAFPQAVELMVLNVFSPPGSQQSFRTRVAVNAVRATQSIRSRIQTLYREEVNT